MNTNVIVGAIVGLSKNAGKTTFLNWFVKQNLDKQIGITTTGRDGEDVDILTETEKPKVFIPKHSYVTSFHDILGNNLGNLECVQKLPFRVIGKNIWLFKALTDLETEIIGPTTVKEQIELINLFKEKGCDLVLVDGSLDRKSICLSPVITDVYLVVGASAGSLYEISELAKKIKIYIDGFSPFNDKVPTLNNFPHIYGNETEIITLLNKNPEYIYLSGVLTEASWQKLKNSLLNYKGKIIFNHALKVIINIEDLKRLCDNGNVYTITKLPLNTVIINSFSVKNIHIDVELLKQKMSNIFGDIVLDARQIT